MSSFVKSTSTAFASNGKAVRLDAIIHVRAEQIGSVFTVTARLLDGSEYPMEDHTTLADAQTALARWLDALGQVTV